MGQARRRTRYLRLADLYSFSFPRSVQTIAGSQSIPLKLQISGLQGFTIVNVDMAYR